MLKDKSKCLDNNRIQSEIAGLKEYFKGIFNSAGRQVAEEQGKSKSYNKLRFMENVFPFTAMAELVLILVWDMFFIKCIPLGIVSLVATSAFLTFSKYVGDYGRQVRSPDMTENSQWNVIVELDEYFDKPSEYFRDSDEKLDFMIDELSEQKEAAEKKRDDRAQLYDSVATTSGTFAQLFIGAQIIISLMGKSFPLVFLIVLVFMLPTIVNAFKEVWPMKEWTWNDDVLLKSLKLLRLNRTETSDNKDNMLGATMDDNLKETILNKQEIYAIMGNQLNQVKERQKVSYSLLDELEILFMAEQGMDIGSLNLELTHNVVDISSFRLKSCLSLSQNTIVYMDPSKIVSDLSFLKAYDLIECENEIYSLKKPDGVEITKELIKETYGS